MQPLIHYLLGPFKRGVITPTLTRGGDLLEHVPERWRPPVRTRDRLAKRRPVEADPDARHSPLLSPIGLEPVVNDPGPTHAPQWPDFDVPAVASVKLKGEVGWGDEPGRLSSNQESPAEIGSRVHPAASASRAASRKAGFPSST